MFQQIWRIILRELESADNAPVPEKPVPPDYETMAQRVKVYAESVLEGSVGEWREEVKALLDSLHSSLEHSASLSHRYNLLPVRFASDALADFDDIVGPLKNEYGVADTQELESIQEALRNYIECNSGHQRGGMSNGRSK